MASLRTPSRPAITQDDLPAWVGAQTYLHLDIGTGDGTYALRLARSCPGMAVIGVDTCLDNLTKAARKPSENLRFLAGDAFQLPSCLHGRASAISINFPYGSLLQAVGVGNASSWARLLSVARPDAQLDIRINASAGAQYGLTLEEMQRHVDRMLRLVAPTSATVTIVPQNELRTFPSTWAKRLAYGRPSQVIVATARLGV